MLKERNNKIEFNPLQCQQCGVCAEVCPTASISYIPQTDGTKRIVIDKDSCILCRKCVKVCPSNQLHTPVNELNLRDKNYYLGYNSNNDVQHKASSGGVARTLIVESLKSGDVDCVYSLKKSDKYPFVKGCIYTKDNIPDYNDIPNSIYHSVMIGDGVKDLKPCNRLMIVGTSCQLKSLKIALKGRYKELVTVCIFCKQQKTLNSTRFLAKAVGTKIDSDKLSVQYRGTGWPGYVKINNKALAWHRAAQLPFGRRLWSVKGCNVCADPFGAGADADIALMDPWMIRKPNNLGETLVVALTECGNELLKTTENLTIEQAKYAEIEPALGLKDIWCKEQLVPFFRGEECSAKVKLAGNMEQFQRWYIEAIVKLLPKMPFVAYRAICKLPDLRNIILK